MVNYLWLMLATVVSAVMYRMGGASGYNTKIRDCGVATVGMCVLWFLCPHSTNTVATILSIILSGGLMFAASTTYFKWKGQPARWWNWALVGIAFGVSALPYSIAVGSYDTFAMRVLFLGVTIPVWSEHVENVVWEEGGRGALVIASLGLFI